MRAYKFLDRAGATVITCWSWPRPDGDDPGPWVEAERVRPCREGIHACRADDLAYWISDQLWEIELDGEIVQSHHKVVGRRGRLVRRIAEWTPDTASELAAWGAWRSRDHAEQLLRDREQERWAEHLGSAATLRALAVAGAAAAHALDEDDPGGMAAGYAGDAARITLAHGFAEASFVAACAAGHVAALDGDTRRFDVAFAEERHAQSAWLTTRLGLS